MNLEKLVNVEDQYKKFKDIERNEVLKLVDWVKQQPHLPQITELEAFLFLHSCYGSMEVAKNTLDMNYTIRTHCPDVFSNRDILGDDIRNIMNVVAITPLPKSTPAGENVVIAKLKDFDSQKFVFVDSVKLDLMAFEYWLMSCGTANGHIVVIDMNGCELGHVARLGLSTMKKFLYYLQEAAPIRIKGFHFVNIVPFVDKILALMRPFLKKELMDVLHLHQTLDQFHEFIPKDILPSDFGGVEPKSEEISSKFYEELIANREYFLEEENTRRVNEKLRPGKPKNASDLFGVEGNFKKLDID